MSEGLGRERKRVVVIIGTRPEAIKLAPVVIALRNQSWVDLQVVVTAQHRGMLDDALQFFGIKADIDLNLMTPGQTLGHLTGTAFIALERALKQLAPDIVLAQGDTTTVMATAVSCFYTNIPFGHVEAGLRSGSLQSPFPEEFNRLVAGKLARFHFAPTARAAAALQAEGVEGSRVFLTGNTVIDALAYTLEGVDPGRFRPESGRRLILVTAHRRENFGASMRAMFQTLRRIVECVLIEI